MPEKRTVLVTGATGQQGGSVVSALRARGHTVRALSRTPGSDAAKALAAAGVEVRQGDFSEPATLAAAADGVDTVFLMGTPFEAGIQAETDQGIAAIDAARKAGVGHLIYASVAAADQNTGIPHFDSKFAVERHLAASGLNYTISAPVWFMENLAAPWMAPALQQGNLALALPADRVLQQIAVADIGAFITSLVERRDAVFGKRYDIAGDATTGSEIASVISEATGRDIAYQQVPLDMVRQQNEDMALMFEWFDKVGYSADIERLRRDFPEVPWRRFADWAKSFNWRFLDASQAA